MPTDITDPRRRRLLRAAGLAVAAARIGSAGPARAQGAPGPAAAGGFAPLRQAEAGLLRIAYAESGPAAGPPVILLHGWPYDIHTYAEVAPLLAAAGHRVIVPYLRGYGPTRFLSGETPRNGQQSVVAVDIIALMDALKIPAAIVGGCDWGARTANIM